VEISEDELLKILDTSPQLERLSLVQVGPRTPAWRNTQQFTHGRTVQLPGLAFLRLGNSPEVVGYILAHIDTPSITPLEIHSRITPQDVMQSLNLMVPNDRLQERLFSNPPVFEIETTDDRTPGIMIVDIGSCKMWFDFDFENDAEAISNTITTHLQPLVPRSVTTLKIACYGLALAELGWREFVISHQEVRSIECSNSSDEPVSGTPCLPPERMRSPHAQSLSLSPSSAIRRPHVYSTVF